MTPALEASGLAFRYGGGFRLAGVSFQVAPAEVFAIVGPNGSGKTTLLRLLTRVLEPEAGEVRVRGVPVARLPRRALARAVAVVPQALALAFPFTVEELCLMGRYPHAEGRLFEGDRDVERAREAMALTGVLDLARRPLDALSGGDRQRALVARALAQEAPALLLDEPTSHLDLRHQREMAALLRRLNRERQTTVVLVTHDLNLAGELADRILLLVGGRVVRLGVPADVLEERVLEEAYGCPVWVDKSPLSGRPVVHVRWPETGGGR